MQTMMIQNTIDVSDATPLTIRKIGNFGWIGQLVILIVLPNTIVAIGSPIRRPRSVKTARQMKQKVLIESFLDIEPDIKDIIEGFDGWWTSKSVSTRFIVDEDSSCIFILSLKFTKFARWVLYWMAEQRKTYFFSLSQFYITFLLDNFIQQQKKSDEKKKENYYYPMKT